MRSVRWLAGVSALSKVPYFFSLHHTLLLGQSNNFAAHNKAIWTRCIFVWRRRRVMWPRRARCTPTRRDDHKWIHLDIQIQIGAMQIINFCVAFLERDAYIQWIVGGKHVANITRNGWTTTLARTPCDTFLLSPHSYWWQIADMFSFLSSFSS